MKALNLRKSYLVGLAILALAVTAIFINTSGLSAQSSEDEYHTLLGYHGYQSPGGVIFESASTESISANVEEKYLDRKGLATRELNVRGMAGRGYSEGLGETMYWLDKSRPVKGSVVRAKTPGAEYPAVHEMHFHLLLVSDIFPGKTLRSINPAIMVNNNATSFPPKPGARYQLKNVVELEDVENPGEVMFRIVSNRNQIIGAGRLPLDPAMEPQR
ncbi:MAG TPA: hypothetical protein VEL74_12135 [Thermoanaerobaculia bacterium]|nr:hypothetical protein [Thermoanaerobaculia bacterium]